MSRNPNSKPATPQPDKAGKPSVMGLAVITLLAFAGAYLWTSHQTKTPAATQTVHLAKIYSETAHPTVDIPAALDQAQSEHKRVLLDFGADWCGDCQVLDYSFHQPANAALLASNYILVHVWVGQMDANLGVAEKYGVPIHKGIPALAVLSPDGKVIYAQATGEFKDLRNMDPASVTEFLEKWKS
ncbi:MAG: thioredoxin family protein [Acidobacteriaceae bacterium]|nr:thioredoxin family protein [Acidobacteriaceae bacterium]